VGQKTRPFKQFSTRVYDDIISKCSVLDHVGIRLYFKFNHG